MISGNILIISCISLYLFHDRTFRQIYGNSWSNKYPFRYCHTISTCLTTYSFCHIHWTPLYELHTIVYSLLLLIHIVLIGKCLRFVRTLSGWVRDFQAYVIEIDGKLKEVWMSLVLSKQLWGRSLLKNNFFMVTCSR